MNDADPWLVGAVQLAVKPDADTEDAEPTVGALGRVVKLCWVPRPVPMGFVDCALK